MVVNQAPTGLYALTFGDHPGLVLISQPLTETNYNSSSRSTRMVLNSKRKFSFIDGSIPKPPPNIDPSLLEWL